MGGDSISLFTPLILAGGLGTRLRGVIRDIPKPLAIVQDRPFITYILDQLTQAGFNQATILTGYQAEKFEETLGSNYQGISLRFSKEPSILGTAGAIKYCAPQIKTPYVLVLNGDSIIDINFKEIINKHLSNQSQVSVILTSIENSERYGSVFFDNDFLITSFQEKTPSAHTSWINAGIYIINTKLLDTLPALTQLSLEKEILPLWVSDRKVHAIPMPERTFIDIGIPSSYQQAQEMAVFSGENKL